MSDLSMSPNDNRPQNVQSPSEEDLLYMLDTSEVRCEIDNVIADVLYDELANIKNEISNYSEPSPTDGSINDFSDIYVAIRREFSQELCKWTYKDQSGFIYGFSEDIEAYTIRKDEIVYICDILHEVDIPNIVVLLRIGKLYKTLHAPKALSCIIFTRKISAHAYDTATKFKIRVVVVNSEEK